MQAKSTDQDPFLKHEALDRCHVLLSTLDEHLLQHPFVQQHGDIHRAVKSAGEALAEAYQLIGNAGEGDE